MSLTSVERAYIAGIIDGEGSIMLQRSNARASEAYVFLIIKVANTNKKLLDWLQLKIGKGKIQYISKMHKGCKDCYHWTIASNEAYELLNLVYPYLVIKTKQADAALALRAENTAALAITGKNAFGHGNSIPAWLMHFRESLYWYVRDLNWRGIEKSDFGKKVLQHMVECQKEEALLCR